MTKNNVQEREQLIYQIWKFLERFLEIFFFSKSTQWSPIEHLPLALVSPIASHINITSTTPDFEVAPTFFGQKVLTRWNCIFQMR